MLHTAHHTANTHLHRPDLDRTTRLMRAGMLLEFVVTALLFFIGADAWFYLRLLALTIVPIVVGFAVGRQSGTGLEWKWASRATFSSGLAIILMGSTTNILGGAAMILLLPVVLFAAALAVLIGRAGTWR